MSAPEDSSALPESSADAADLCLPELSGRSRKVLETLGRHQGRADRFYEGALRALTDRSNPVRAESAAYCLRQLILELERVALASNPGPRLGDLFQAFRPRWEAAERRPEDNGLVDHCDPAVFAVDQFLKDADAAHTDHRDRAQMTLAELDPAQRPGPPDTYQARVRALFDFHGEFNRILHGKEPTDPGWFESRVEAFERFLLVWLRPRTFEDFRDIDDLLAEGPPT